jgi:hypothetical protein
MSCGGGNASRYKSRSKGVKCIFMRLLQMVSLGLNEKTLVT